MFRETTVGLDTPDENDDHQRSLAAVLDLCTILGERVAEPATRFVGEDLPMCV